MPEQHPALTTAIGLTSLTYGLIFFSVLAARILPPHELENQRQGYDLLAICFCSNSAVLYSGLVKRAWAVAAKMQRLSRPAFIRANCITVHTWRPEFFFRPSPCDREKLYCTGELHCSELCFFSTHPASLLVFLFLSFKLLHD